MYSRSLTLLAATLLAAPFTFAADGEGPGIRPDQPGAQKPQEARDEVKRPDGDRNEGNGLFRKFDVDHSEDVSPKEFMNGVRIMMQRRQEGGQGDRPQRPEGKGGDRPQRPEGKPAEGPDQEKLAMHAAQIFKNSDHNGNGSLDEEEFRKAVGAIMKGGQNLNRRE